VRIGAGRLSPARALRVRLHCLSPAVVPPRIKNRNRTDSLSFLETAARLDEFAPATDQKWKPFPIPATILGAFRGNLHGLKRNNSKDWILAWGPLAFGDSRGKWPTNWARQRSFSEGLCGRASQITEEKRQREGEDEEQRDCFVLLSPLGLTD
jgi:hypothetical protein